MSTSIHLTFVEGGSAKFWQAEQQDKHIILRWGRLGTTGQQQEKSFASAAEATDFLRKQADSKRKKGYQENADNSTASEPPQAITPTCQQQSPPEPVPASYSGLHVAWTPALRQKRLVYRWQDGAGETQTQPPSHQDAASAWKSLRAALKNLRIQPGDTQRHILLEQLRELGLRGNAPSEVSPELAASLLHLVPTRGCVDWLWFNQGPKVCVQAALDALHGRLEWGWPDSQWHWETEPWQGQMFREQPSWLALQEQIRSLPASDYQALREVAAGLYAQTPLMQRVLLAFCFPQEQAWIEEAAQTWSDRFQCPASGDLHNDLGFLLWPLLQNQNIQSAYLKHYRALPKHSYQRGTVTSFASHWAFWLVEYAQAAAVTSLSGWIRSGETAALRKNAAEALALLHGPEGWQAMADLLDTREGSKLFPEQLLSAPEQTLPIVRTYCATHPEAAEAKRLLAKLELLTQPAAMSPPPQLSAHSAASPEPELRASDLPDWLYNPPWQNPTNPSHGVLTLHLNTQGAYIQPFANGQFHDLHPYVHGKPPALSTRDQIVQSDLEQRWAKGKLHLDDLDRLSQDAALDYQRRRKTSAFRPEI